MGNLQSSHIASPDGNSVSRPAIEFDAVVMLTWSDWHTEPRSNRYHYATRFARHWPVYFVQPDGEGEEVVFESVGNNIILVHIASDYGPAQAKRLAQALRDRGVTRPLVWFYNIYMVDAIARLHPALSVYHATEDYVSPPDAVKITVTDISSLARTAIAHADMVVAVSEGVAQSHRQVVSPGKPLLVLENGCDFVFWAQSGAAAYVAPPDGAKVALFQGGINGRLDYKLLMRLTELLPDWQFWFCGKSIDGGAEWQALKARPNVRDFGLLNSEGIADLARQSRVGLIPFKGSDLMRRSLPLKAYEYLACGLPVVSVPIDALSARPDLFTIAQSAEAFAAALRKLDPTRTDPEALDARRKAAAATSYDARFAELTKALQTTLESQCSLTPSLNILMLYDDGSTHVGTITEHLDAFRKYSTHNVHFMPATGYPGLGSSADGAIDLSAYDAVFVHYSVRISVASHLSPAVAAAVAAYRGPKLLFIQDEYDRVESSRGWMERLGIDTVFTTIPLNEIDKVYPRARFPLLDFIPTLTGYVPEDPALDSFALPIAERHLRIAYRGRALPHHYGALGREKYDIGVEMRRITKKRGIAVDIEVDESRRIYGAHWYRFIGSARSTLGTESGANVFDMDGSLSALAEQHRDMPYDKFAKKFLRDHEGLLSMNQVSPKIFEAIRLRTALVLFEGSYSGVVRAHEHYIPLAKDYSNVDEVLAKLEDIPFLEALTERAYRDIIATGDYSYRKFIEGVDAYVTRKAGGRRRATIFSVPVLALYSEGSADSLLMRGPDAAMVSGTILRPGLTRAMVKAFGEAILPMQETCMAQGPGIIMTKAPAAPSLRTTIKILLARSTNRGWERLKDLKSIITIVLDRSNTWGRACIKNARTLFKLILMSTARLAWRFLPQSWRRRILTIARETIRDGVPQRSLPSRMARPFWQIVPSRLRSRIAARLA